MKSKKLSYSLMTALMFLLCALMAFTAVACTDDVARVEGPETGVYYYDSPQGEYIITLNSVDKFAFMVMGENKSGTYKLEGETLTLTLNDEENAFATAVLKDGVITLTYNNAEMRFIKKVAYTVTFESNGGSAVESISVINGKSFEKPADPVRAGYAFLGWYADEGFSTAFAFGTDIVTADTTVYAKWGKTEVGQSEFTVSFDLNYEGAEKQASVKTMGGKLYTVATPVRSGFTFNGWWLSSSNSADALTYAYTADTVFEENTTLFALWSSTENTSRLASPAVSVVDGSVRWAVVSGASSYRVQITGPEGFASVDETVSTPGFEPEFILAGDYTVKVTANASAEANSSEPAVRVYRHKALKRVSLFEVVEPSVLLFNAVEHAENYYITVECGNPNHVHTELANGSSTNYNFANCSMQEGGIKFTVRATAAGYADSVSDVFVCDRTLNKIDEVTYDSDTQTILWNSVPNASRYIVTVKNGDNEYVFDAGNVTKLCVKELAPAQNAFEVGVVPVTNGYNSPEAAKTSFTKTSLAAPSEILLEGMNVSWNDVGAASYEITVSGQKFTSNTNSFDLATATGIDWTVSRYYTLSVRAAGDNGSLWSDEKDIRYLAMFNTLSYSGGILSWGHVAGATSYEVQLNDGEAFTVEGGKNYAEIELDKAGENTLSVRFNDPEDTSDVWVSVSAFAYTVTFDSRGGTSVDTVYRAAGDKNNFPEPERAGHDFAGWYTIPGGAEANGAEYTDEIFAESHDLNLYAYFVPKQFDVTLKLRTADDDVYTVVQVKYGRQFTLPVPRLTGDDADKVTFAGWYSGVGGAGTRLTDGNGKGVSLWPFAEDITVYAFWDDLILSYEEAEVDGLEGYAVYMEDKILKQTVINIPESYMGKPVVKILDNAFGSTYACSEILEINIPDSVRLISSVTPFSGCSNLEAVNVYHVENNTTIRYASDDGVLLDYGRIDDKTSLADLIFVPQSKRGKYVVSDKVQTIVSTVFKDSKITSIEIPSSVSHIGNGAFENSSLREVTFLNSAAATPLLTIADRAFLNCKNIVTIELPARLDKISLSRYTYNRSGDITNSLDEQQGVTDSFYGCSSLASIMVASGNKNYSSEGGVLFNANKSSLLYYPVAKSGDYSVPSTVSSIADGAFFKCEQLTGVTVPAAVASIGECAFYQCTALVNLEFGGQRGAPGTSIGKFAFRDCSALENISYDKDSNIKSVREGAFYNCDALKEVVLPSTLTSVEKDAFRNCDYLVSLRFDEENEDKIEESGLKLTLGDDIYSDCKRLERVYLSKYITGIPVFSGCGKLTDLTLSKGHPTLSGFGKEPVINNQNVLVSYPLLGESVYVVPENVVKIADSAFRSRNIEKITIGKNVTEIGKDAFADCRSLKEVIFEQADGEAKELIIESGAFAGCNALSKITIPARTVKIGANAFNMLDTNAATGLELLEFEDGIRLEAIGSAAFAGTNISHVTIPASVKVIEDSAFYATGLVSVDFAEGTVLEVIGSGAFAGQPNIGSGYKMSPLKEITIPKTVTTIRPSAFANCVNLTSVIFEKGGDKELEIGAPYQVAIGENHERGNVFHDCEALEEINLPARCVSIGYYTFSLCENLKRVTFAEEGQESKLKFIDEAAFRYSGITSITIPKSVGNQPSITLLIGGIDTPYDRPAIGAEAFSYCMSLESVVFEAGGQNAVTIGAKAFEGRRTSTDKIDGVTVETVTYIALKTITLPATLAEYERTSDNLPAIPGGLFGDCYYLESINVNAGSTNFVSYDGVLYNKDFKEIVVCPLGKTGELDLNDNLEKINSEIFYGCSEITSIVIPGTITEISNVVLVNLTGLREIKVKGENALYKAENGVLLTKDGTTLISVPINYGEEYTVPDGVTSIGDSAFASCKIKTIVIPASVEKLGVGVFRNCTQLTSLTFKEESKITELPDYTFVNCSSLTTVRIPAGVTELPGQITVDDGYGSTYSIFTGCNSLKSVTFEQGSVLTKIGESCFENIESLESIVLPDSLTEIGINAFKYCQGLTSVVIPAGVTELPEGLFYYCENLSSVTFAAHSELNKIGKQAFYLCTALTSVIIPEEVTEIGEQAFCACYALTNLRFAGNNITTFGKKAFSDCKGIKSFIVPDSVTEISEGLFWSCEALEQITLHDNITTIGELAFIRCSSLTSVNLPESVTSLGAYCFQNSGLTSFTLPKNVVVIPDEAFSGCTELTEVTLHGAVTHIGRAAFSNTGLTSFEIPAMVSSIGISAFSGVSLDAFTVNSANQSYQVKDGILFSKDGKTLVSVPAGKTGSYTIPQNTTVASGAFYGSQLTEVTLSSGVTLSESAFSYSLIKKVTANFTNVNISNYAFQNCRQLEEISFGTRVRTINIGRSAFSGCTSLKAFTVNNVNTEITVNAEAFYDCYALETVNLKTKSITLNEKAFQFNSLTGNLPALKTVVLEAEGDITIGNEAFTYLYSIENLTVTAKGKVDIGEDAFSLGGVYQDVSLLKSVEISGADVTLGSYAFRRNVKLEKVAITAVNSVTVGSYAFNGCGNIFEVAIKATAANSTVKLNSSALKNCWKMYKLELDAASINLGADSLAYDFTKNPDDPFGQGMALGGALASFVLTEKFTVDLDAFSGWGAQQTIYVTLTETEVANSRWDERWNRDCSAKIVYGYTQP